MSILDSELLMFKSLAISDLTGNGGKMDNAAQASTGVVNNVWPSVFRAERTDGSTKWRKTFLKVQNDDDLIFYYPQIWLDIVTPGDDWVTFFAGTQTDTQGGTTHTGAAAADHYGCGTLQTNVSIGGQTIIVTVEDVSLITGGADEIFRDGDTIRITDKVDPTSGTGNEEIHTIDGTPTNSGNNVTITIVGTLANAFTTASNTRVMSVYEPDDVEASWDSWVETCAGDGTYDEATTGNVVADNIGSIEEEYEVAFTDATNFTIRDFADNVIGSWTTSQDAIPLNSDNSKPLFTLLAAGWADTWASGDTIVFETHPAAVPIWQQRVVPAAADSLAGDRTTVAITGESV